MKYIYIVYIHIYYLQNRGYKNFKVILEKLFKTMINMYII